MAFFPFFIDIQNKKCTLIGGGTVAARKAEALLPFGCHITVIAPQFCHELRQMEGLQLIQRCFEPKDLENSFFVIAATNNSAVNAQISNFCHRNHILVNVVDVMEECSFIFPSLYKNQDIVVGVTTAGKSPQTAALLRKFIEESIPKYYGDMVARLGTLRSLVKEKVPAQKQRKKLLSLILKEMLATENKISNEEIENIIRGQNYEN